jgi:Asp/Glu/hydantoin racemase
MSTKVAIIHATRVAVAPIEATFGRLWPQAETVSILEESLSRDLDRAGEMTPDMFDRLARFAQEGGAQGILFSCSAFGVAIEAVRATLDVPVLKPNETMLEEALEAGGRLCLAATFQPSIPSIRKELVEMAKKRGDALEVDLCFVPGALEALHKGDPEAHDALIAEAVCGAPDCDVVILAQFSMARALPAVADRVGAKVLSSPDSAVRKLRELIHPPEESSLFGTGLEAAGARLS